MKFLYQSFIIILLLVLAGCSTSTQQSTDADSGQDQEIYVFDDVGISDSAEINTSVIETKKLDTVAVKKTPPVLTGQFIVQVGAFTSQDRAQLFVDEHQTEIGWKMQISFSQKVQLFVVQLPPFATRSEAENVRTQLWQTSTFRDAFIVPEENN